MGGQGMRFSLPSRDIIADSIESVMVGQSYDANVSIVGCDKNPPGALMAAMRYNRPCLLVWGGTSAYCWNGRRVTKEKEKGEERLKLTDDLI